MKGIRGSLIEFVYICEGKVLCYWRGIMHSANVVHKVGTKKHRKQTDAFRIGRFMPYDYLVKIPHGTLVFRTDPGVEFNPEEAKAILKEFKKKKETKKKK